MLWRHTHSSSRQRKRRDWGYQDKSHRSYSQWWNERVSCHQSFWFTYFSTDVPRTLLLSLVETKYKELKSRLAIEEFSGATTTSVLQEFYINVLLSNLSSLIKNQVDEEIQITAKSTNKYRYQANRAFIIGRVKTIVPKILCNLFDLSAIDRLYKDSLRCRSQIMPGRTFRRKKNKAIGRTHFNNKKVAF